MLQGIFLKLSRKWRRLDLDYVLLEALLFRPSIRCRHWHDDDFSNDPWSITCLYQRIISNSRWRQTTPILRDFSFRYAPIRLYVCREKMWEPWHACWVFSKFCRFVWQHKLNFQTTQTSFLLFISLAWMQPILRLIKVKVCLQFPTLFKTFADSGTREAAYKKG